MWLKSGGYLVIQPAEALTVVDVNTGKYTEKKKDDTFLKINLEAAKELARQLRLRNLSGIIIADFIDMDREEDKERLLCELADELKKDPVKAVLVDMTPLGLVEITRRRSAKHLRSRRLIPRLSPLKGARISSLGRTPVAWFTTFPSFMTKSVGILMT